MDERDKRHAQADDAETPGDAPDWRAGLVWGPGVPVLLAALAIGQMGVHLVFFLHISSGPEGTNTILALAFGVFVVALVVFGSLVIMANLDAGMVTMDGLMRMQR